MRKTLLILSISLFIFSNAYTQTKWEWQYPLPQGNRLEHIFFLNEETAWACGDKGTIIKTTDGGESWFNLDAGDNKDYKNFTRIAFVDENHGWATGISQASTVETNDGGNTWFYSKTLTGLYEELFFKDGIGWACSIQGEILKSTDQGNTWITLDTITSFVLKDLFMLDENTGWACGSGGNIIGTSDCWANYENVKTYTKDVLHEIHAVEQDGQYILMIGGEYGSFSVCRATGSFWDTITMISDIIFSSFAFSNNTVGFATGSGTGNYAMMQTTDGGTDWVIMDKGEGLGHNSIDFINESRGFIVGEGGMILKTRDGGITWENTNNSSIIALNDIFFVDDNYGWACGTDGMILKTSDGGNTWIQKPTEWINDIEALFFLDENNGYYSSQNCIASTTDGGENWDRIYGSTRQYDIYFKDVNNGFICDAGGMMYTDDGGKHMHEVNNLKGNGLRSIFFLDNNLGWTVGSFGVIFHTTDGGVSWTQQECATSQRLYDVSFFDKNNGIAVGGNDTEGIIQRTTDGGISWKTSIINYSSLISVAHTGPQTAYTCSKMGKFLKTTDGGANWTEESRAMDGETHKMFFVGNKGWVVGNCLNIKHFHAGNVAVDDKQDNQNNSLKGNVYPNPFTDFTNIDYYINSNGFVSIKIFDIEGNEVASILNEKQEQGRHNIYYRANNLQSGTYYIEIKHNENRIIRKGIFIK